MDKNSPTTSASSKPTAKTTKHENLVHESRIPPIATKAHTQPPSTSTTPLSTLSFALPTSPAIFKRLTWELTPWTLPLSPTTATTLTVHLPTLPPSSIHHALCLGTAYTTSSSSPKAHRPHLYVLFPHLHRAISSDESFLSTWHDEIVKPAFDEAWVQSGLVDVYEKTEGETVWVTEKAGPKAKEVYDRYYGSEYPWLRRAQHREWPAWRDEWAFKKPPEEKEGRLGKGLEGGWSDKRARVFEEVWASIRGMLKGEEGEEGEMDDPVLLAVWEREVEVEAEDVGGLVRVVGREWDGYADSRFVKEEGFFVHLDGCVHEVEMGDEPEGVEDDSKNADGSVDPEVGSNDFGWLGTLLSMVGL